MSQGDHRQVSGLHVAITGGAGLIGSRLARELLARDARGVVLLDNFVRGIHANLDAVAGDPRLRVVEGDIRDRKVLRQALAGADVVYHLAALRIPRCQEAPMECVDSMVRGSLSVFQHARGVGASRVVFASSHAVYGQPQGVPVAEEHPLTPVTIYGAAKVAGETFLQAVGSRDGLDYTILRFFNVYGPGMRRMGPHAEVLMRWMDALARGQRPRIHDGGRGTLDIVHVDDVVFACVAALGPAGSRAIFNVGSGQEVSLLELAQALMQTTGSPASPDVDPPDRSLHPARYCADIRRARELLGFHPAVVLERGLSDLWRWYSGNGGG